VYNNAKTWSRSLVCVDLLQLKTCNTWEFHIVPDKNLLLSENASSELWNPSFHHFAHFKLKGLWSWLCWITLKDRVMELSSWCFTVINLWGHAHVHGMGELGQSKTFESHKRLVQRWSTTFDIKSPIEHGWYEWKNLLRWFTWTLANKSSPSYYPMHLLTKQDSWSKPRPWNGRRIYHIVHMFKLTYNQS
jgi:hypothetical protein